MQHVFAQDLYYFKTFMISVAFYIVHEIFLEFLKIYYTFLQFLSSFF